MVESVMSQVKFSTSRLEKYFNNIPPYNKGLNQRLSNDFENIDCRSTHTIARGSVQMVFTRKNGASVCIDIPTSAHFLVTGLKTYGRPYRLRFAASLS